MAGPNDFSGKKRVRDFEKDALRDALIEEHENGGHEDAVEPNCPRCPDPMDV